MPNPAHHRYLLRFAKTAAMRYTGHLDLHRTLERTLRRAGLPLAYSQGFTPHPRLSLAAALPLGCTSSAELAEFRLEHDIAPEAVAERLRQVQPPGLQVLEVSLLPRETPALQTLVAAAEYEVTLLDAPEFQELAGRVTALMAARSLPRQRRGRPYDLRPLIEHLEVHSALAGEVHLRMRLSAGEGASGRADEVLSALRLDPTRARIHRTRLYLRASPLHPVSQRQAAVGNLPDAAST